MIKLCWQSLDEISGSGKCWAGFGMFHYLSTIQQPEGQLSFLFGIRCPLHFDTTCILIRVVDSINFLMSIMMLMSRNMPKHYLLLTIESFKYKTIKNYSVIRFGGWKIIESSAYTTKHSSDMLHFLFKHHRQTPWFFKSSARSHFSEGLEYVCLRSGPQCWVDIEDICGGLNKSRL